MTNLRTAEEHYLDWTDGTPHDNKEIIGCSIHTPEEMVEFAKFCLERSILPENLKPYTSEILNALLVNALRLLTVEQKYVLADNLLERLPERPKKRKRMTVKEVNEYMEDKRERDMFEYQKFQDEKSKMKNQ